MTFLIDAETSLAIVFCATVAAIDTEPPTKPAVRASEAAMASEVIDETSFAQTTMWSAWIPVVPSPSIVA